MFLDARLVHYCEWCYGSEGADMGFDLEFATNFDDRARIRTWNALHTLDLEHCNQGVTPTRCQRQQHPLACRDKIAVIHEGINTDKVAPNPSAVFTTPSGVVLKAGHPLITFIARTLELYRSFYIFMRALERIQQQHPTCHAVIVGGDDGSYRRRPLNGCNGRAKTWREPAERTDARCKPHPLRWQLPYEDYPRMLQVSAAHAYLTYPFVLSWSLLEALACGCPVIASDIAPVREVIADGVNGQLVSSHDVEAIANAAMSTLVKTTKSPCRGTAGYGITFSIAAYGDFYRRTYRFKNQEL